MSEIGLIVGGGSIGRRHARNLQQLDIEVCVADPDVTVREQFAADFGVTTFSGLSEALDSSSPEFVVICAPNALHVELATEAAEAGCDLFIEKPLSQEMTGIPDLETTIANQKTVSLVGCNLRFHPAIRRIRELLQDNVIGSIIAARIEGGSYLPGWFPESDYTESYSAKEDLGGGVILDFVHEINYARWFFNEFVNVSAIAGSRTHLNIETNDVAGILAETYDGIICEFHFDYIQQEYSRSCHVIGEEGTIRWSWQDEVVEWYVADEDKWYTFNYTDRWEINEMYIDEMRHFISCLRNREETICPVKCGKNDLAVALAARESSTSGQNVTPASLKQ